MMYSIKSVKEDVRMVKSMLKVIEPFRNCDSFRVCDIDKYTKQNYHRYDRRSYSLVDFNGSSMDALVRRGFVEVVDTEDYIYKDRYGKHIGTRKVYRCTGATFEDYKRVLAGLLYKSIVAM